MKNKNNFLGFFETRSRTTEAVAGVAALMALAYLLRSLLTGKTTLAHDNLAWNYPVFQFFAENIINGHFPFWNPFSHGGEPFYPLLGQLRLFEPTALLTIYLGHFLTNDIVILFNWNRVIQTLIMSFGAYICLRPFAVNLFVRLTLIPVVLFSSFFLGSFRQDAILNQFMWVPFIAYLFLRIAYHKDYRWHNWLFAAVLIGINYQSYFFSGVLVFILFFIAGVAIFRADLLKELFKSKQFILKLVAALFIISMMAAPNIVLMFERNDYVFPARMMDIASNEALGGPMQHEGGTSLIKVHGISMPYNFIKFTGTFSTTTDFVQMISPDGNDSLKWAKRIVWGRPSEAYIYLGLLVWALGILGMVCARHELKRVWLFICVMFAFLMLGPSGGVHRVLYYVYPPMWFVRHTHAFVLFFVFSFIYFYVLGLNHLFSTWKGHIFKPVSAEAVLKSRPLMYFIAGAVFVLGAVTAVVLFMYYMPFAKQLAHTISDYLFLFLLPVFVSLWYARKRLGEKFIYLIIIAVYIALALVFNKNITAFFRNFSVFLGVPFLIFFLFKNGWAPKRLKARLPAVLMAVFIIFLTGDLVYAFWKTSFFYGDNPHPGQALNVSTVPKRADFIDARLPFIPNPDTGPYQSMRYLSLIYRQPEALSSVKEDDAKGLYKTYAKEIFFDSKKASSLLPESCAQMNRKYSQVQLDGAAVLKIPPCPKDKACYEYRSCDVEHFAGSYVWFSAWVKRVAKETDVVQVCISEGTDVIISKIYVNKGDWEWISVGKYISNDSKRVEVFVYVSPGGQPAYFKDAVIETGFKGQERVNMEYALKNLRWSSFLLPAAYFNLVNSGISPRVMEKIFAINGPLIQFKKDVIQLDDGLIPDYLKKLGDNGAIKLLAEKAFVDNVPPDNASKTFAGEGSKFSYSVRQYDYDSIYLKVSSPSNGFLYWADGYNKNWHAYVNGVEAPVARANMDFKIIRLPKGESEVRFVYKANRFKYGLGLFYGALFAGVSVGLITYATGRKES